MGYGDNRYGSDEYRNRGGSDRWRGDDRDSLRGGQRSGREGERGQRGDWGGGRDDDDRGFMERAGERVRSWFGEDDEDRHRRGYDGGRDRGERGMSGPGRESFGAGFGNQRGWRDERWDRDFGPAEGYQGSDRGSDATESGRGGGGSWRDPNIGGSGGGYDGTVGRSSHRGRAESQRMAGYEGGFSGSYGGVHDPHYAEWRQRQLDELDRDYAEYRRENQSRFEQEFGGWREKRQGQRQMMGRVTEQMEVVASDGEHIGTVDKVRGDRIILSRSDSDANGIHHSIPCSSVAAVDQRVTLTKSAEEVRSQWRTDDQNRALFEREDQGQGGPHVLNRSFAGTYRDKDDGSSR